jgi:hypothetical protein
VTAAIRPTCPKCSTRPVGKVITTAVLGAKPVDLALCDCDYLRCPGCSQVIRSLAMGVHTCPHCRRRL